MRAVNTIILASNNDHKLDELRELLKSLKEPIHIEPIRKFIRNSDKIGLAEKFETYAENAAAKARTANQGAHYPCLADDSGLEIEALQGRPGVRSHRYAIPKAGQSQDMANVEKILEELKGHTMDKRKAKFVCSLVLVIEGISIEAEGILEGTIAEAPQGTNGFGYDPIFIPKGSQITLAEMTDHEKNSISHRANALKTLLEKVKSHGVVFAKP